MSKTIKLIDNRSVTIVSAESSETAITPSDAEMDARAKEAVKSAINRAKTCKKPIARYDRVSRKAYIETADGEKYMSAKKPMISMNEPLIKKILEERKCIYET